MAIADRRERERAQRHDRIVTAARTLAEAEGWDAVTTRRLADSIEYSQPVLYSHFENRDAIVAAVAVKGFAELAASLQDAITDTPSPNDALESVERSYVAFAISNPALYDAMFTLATLPFGQPERPAAMRDGFAILRRAVAPFAGDRDVDILTQLTWSALHGLAVLTRTGRLSDGNDEARLSMLTDILTGSSPDHQRRRRPTKKASR
jgi:AcrR family transcriptional regulator